MSGWNYRVVQYDNGDCGLHEVYYDDSGNVNGVTQKAVGFVSDSSYKLKYLIRLAIDDAYGKPILKWSEITTTLSQGDTVEEEE